MESDAENSQYFGNIDQITTGSVAIQSMASGQRGARSLLNEINSKARRKNRSRLSQMFPDPSGYRSDRTHDIMSFQKQNQQKLLFSYNSSVQDNLIEVGEDEGFTMDSAFDKIGGFGRFQFFSLILLVLIRNFGMFQQYGYAVLVAPQVYSCTFERESVSQPG